MADVRVALIGCGRLAEQGYLPALRQVAGARLAAVADPDPARRDLLVGQAAAAGDPPVAAHPDLAALLTGTPVDAVVLATPASVHLEDARRAAAAGLPTLVEKPTAPDAAGAQQLAALTPTPWTAFNRRFVPGNAAVRDAAPTAGPLALRLVLHYRRRSWSPVAVADDALLDLGPHLIDLARWVTGDEVRAVAGARVAPTRVRVGLRLTRSVAYLDAATDRPHRERLELARPGGPRLARHTIGGPVAGVLARVPGRSTGHPLVDPLVRQLDAFVAAVDGPPPPELGTAADGAATLEVIDAIHSSAARGSDRVELLPASAS